MEAFAREDIPDHYHVGDSHLALDVYIASKGEVYVSYDYIGPVGSGGERGDQLVAEAVLPDGLDQSLFKLYFSLKEVH